jgi:large subunit ribosomal protein L7/L12
MFLPVWAIILLGIGWLGFLWLLIKRDSGHDLAEAPRLAPPPAPLFTLPPGPGPEGIPPELAAELRQMVAAGQKIQAIKRVRELTACGLGEAKDWVERL